MEPISETAAATFDLETGGAEGVDPTTTPAERPNRKMIKRESQTVVTDDMSKTEKELMEIHPDGTPWLMSILRAYNKQKTDLELFTEELDKVGERCDALEGVHHAKARREANSNSLRMNSGVSSLNIVDDGQGMRARHDGGELVLSLADLSESTESTLGNASSASGMHQAHAGGGRR